MAEFEVDSSHVSELINEELVVDLFGIFKIGQKGKEESLMLPLASTQIDLPSILLSLHRQRINTTDVVVHFGLEKDFFKTNYPGIM